MKHLLVLAAVLSFLAVPATLNAAEKSRDRAKSGDEKQDDNMPGPAEVRRKADRVVARRKDSVTHTFHNGDTAKFTPAELPADISDAALLDGFVVGWLYTKRPGLEDRLPAGEYIVYLQRINKKWRVSYTDLQGHLKQRSKDVSYNEDKEENPPAFKQSGEAVAYSHWQFSF